MNSKYILALSLFLSFSLAQAAFDDEIIGYGETDYTNYPLDIIDENEATLPKDDENISILPYYEEEEEEYIVKPLPIDEDENAADITLPVEDDYDYALYNSYNTDDNTFEAETDYNAELE